MATYSAVTSGEKDPESPIDVSLIGKLDDNPHAMIEGASGAPKIQAPALDTTAALTDWVLARTAAASVGAVGTYAFAGTITEVDYAPGATIAGSNLIYAGIQRSAAAPADARWNSTAFNSQYTYSVNLVATSLPGTWRCMGRAEYDVGYYYSATLWLRIS